MRPRTEHVQKLHRLPAGSSLGIALITGDADGVEAVALDGPSLPERGCDPNYQEILGS